MAMNPTGGEDPGAAGADPGHEPGRVFSAEYVQQLRRENAGYRTRLRDSEARVGSETRALRIDLALAESKTLEGLDRRYVKFLLAESKTLDSLDPAAADFRERLDEKLSDLVGRNPDLRGGATRQVPTTSGVPAGGPGGPATDQLTLEQLRALPTEQRVAAYKSGRTNWLLGRKA